MGSPYPGIPDSGHVPGGARAPIARVDWGRIAVLSVFWMAVPFVLIPTAQQWITSALAGMINGAMPLFSALVAAVLLRRFPGKPQVAGLAVGFTGVVFITIPGGEGGGSALGVLLVLAATFFYGFSVNVAVPLQQRYGSLPVLLRSLGGAALLTLPLGLAGIADSRWDMLSGLSVLSLGIVGTGIAFVLMATLIGRAGAIRGGVAIYFVPMVAVVLGVVVRDESVAAWALLGILLVLGGTYLTSRREARPG